jgi:hypothetical protein
MVLNSGSEPFDQRADRRNLAGHQLYDSLAQKNVNEGAGQVFL